MGWDASSSVVLDYNFEPPQIKHPAYREVFENADKEVKKLAGTVDGYLHLGSLDCERCRVMLYEATGLSCYTDWSKEKVRELYKFSDWDFEYEPQDEWAYWSAFLFLQICSKLNLSIHFNY